MKRSNNKLDDKIKKLTQDIPKFDMSKIDPSKIDVSKVDTESMKNVLNDVLGSLKEISSFNFGDESDIKRAELLLKNLKEKTTSVTNEIDERIEEATILSTTEKEEKDPESTDKDVDTKK
jgi:hypothetical protein